MQTALLANGCFWCTEAIFQKLTGVVSVEPGYTGGHEANPSYEDVGSGQTGHAEAIRIIFDETVIPYQDLLEIFWYTHDPTTLNRQGNDVGTQYRSAIFYLNNEQKHQAEHMKKRLSEGGVYNQPIVTQIVPASDFYPAEDYHRNFYQNNQDYPYCQIVIEPKLRKMLAKYRHKVSG